MRFNESQSGSPGTGCTVPRNAVRTVVILILFTGAFVWSGCSSSRSHRNSHDLRVMTYNIGHAELPDGSVDLKQVARVINNADPDIVALQDVDRWVLRTGKTDMITTLSDMTGMTYAFGRNADVGAGESGSGVLTRFPILEERNPAFVGAGEDSTPHVMELVLDVRGLELVFFNGHFRGPVGDSVQDSRRAQLLADIREHGFAPAIVCVSLDAPISRRNAERWGQDFVDCRADAGTTSGAAWRDSSRAAQPDYIFVSRSHPPTDSKSIQTSLNPVATKVPAAKSPGHLPLVVDFNIVSE